VIIQVRGTSGSGKTTAVRGFMKGFAWNPGYVLGRKRPLYYTCGDYPGPTLGVLGHYETPTGGCDSIGSAREAFEAVAKVRFHHLIMEGLLLSEDTKWTMKLAEEHSVRCLFLVTPIEECLERIAGRRKEVGRDENGFNPKKSTDRARLIERMRVKLVAAGVDCRRCTSEQAPGLIRRLLGLEETVVRC
jgi:hypothetical protein